MLKNASKLQESTFPFQNLHAEKIKSLLIEKKTFLIIMQIYVSSGRESYLILALSLLSFELLTKCGKIMPLYSQARGDLEVQRFLGIILKN